ncbi:cytochrome b/b6 domain-containing protein [Agriterribacter sp.]|uniref:cytochrome b/b6 domain-containing protein n=1 Tax=Agriterribacter sp. TaxID=2821509 RepID=UPI002B7636F4|nr:cytochrome b/b6 domain-containing protein [Agriterribacter sp.]HRP57503.1 cytochrome b/b6 domain-containing protein [Agriterribacter sp.]
MSTSAGSFHNVAYTRTHRILHWLIAFTFLYMLLTAWLRMNWMNKNVIGEIVTASLKTQNVHLSDKIAANIGRAVRRPMWNTHIYAGYVLLLLYVVRLVVMRIEGTVFSNPFSRQISKKERFRSAVYLVFYICLGTSLLTGIYIELIGKVYPAVYNAMKAVHVQSLYYSVIFIFLHLGGLVLAELGADRGIISRMIHGKRG